MAELADALDLGSSEATRTGSIPARCTNMMKMSPVMELIGDFLLQNNCKIHLNCFIFRNIRLF